MATKNTADLQTDNATAITTNSNKENTGVRVRTFMADVLDSFWNKLDNPLASQAEAQAGTNDTKFMTPLRTAEAIAAQTSGKQTIYVPAGAMMPAATSGAESADNEAATNDVNYKTLAFDDAADEYAHFNVAMPKGWNEGAVTFRVFWSTTATGTTGVAWGLQAVSVSDGDAIDASWGTAVVVTDDAQTSAGDVLVTAESGAVTIGGTPAEGDLTFFRFFRDVSDANDDMTEDALLIGVQILYTTNAPTDA